MAAVSYSRESRGGNTDLWIAGPDRISLVRLTFEPVVDEYPIWSPDGQTITLRRDQVAHSICSAEAADGTGAVEQLTFDRGAAARDGLVGATDGFSR